MPHGKFHLLALALAGSVFALPVNLTGTVTDELSRAVQGAVVQLKGSPSISDTTDASGAYTLIGTVGVLSSRMSVCRSPEWKVRNGAVVVDLPGTARVVVETYSLTGGLAATLVSADLTPGVHHIPLARNGAKSDIVRVRIGDHSTALALRALVGPDAPAADQNPDHALSKALAVADSLIVTHPYFDRSATAVTAYSGTLGVPSLLYKRLNDGEYFRVLIPNGGEVLNYGDTITCAWLQDPTMCQNGMLRVNNGPMSCDYFDDATPYLKANIDTSAATATGGNYFRVVDTKTFVAVCRIILIDKPMTFSGCGATFGGSEMKFSAYDMYAPVGCTNCHDESDVYFTVVK